MKRSGPMGAQAAASAIGRATLREQAPPDALAIALGISDEERLRPARGGDESRHAWWSLSRRGRRRLLVPVQRSCRIAACELLNGALPVAGMRVALALIERVGIPKALAAPPGTIPLDSYLERFFPDQRLRYAVYCGTPSVFEKYTIQCIGQSGSAVAYVKIGRGPEAAEAILTEARVLEELAESPGFEGSIPRVLRVAEEWGAQISILNAPAGGLTRAPGLPTPSIAHFARQLFDSATVLTPWQQSPVRLTLLSTAGYLATMHETGAVELLQGAVEALDEDFGQLAIPHGRAHGDFVPWNIRLSRRPYVFDWEWSRLALPLHDVLHFLNFPAMLRGDAAPIAVREETGRRRRLLTEVFTLAAPERLPFPADDECWLRAYLAQAFAFYSRAAVAAGDSLRGHGLVSRCHSFLAQSLVRS